MSVGGPAISASSSGGGLSGIFATNLAGSPFVIAAADAGAHDILTLVFSCNGNQKVEISYSANFKPVTVGQGILLFVAESGTQVVPGAPIGNGADLIPANNAAGSLWGYEEVLTPTAGSHTYTLRTAAAIGTAGVTIYNATLSVKVYNS